MQRWCDSRGDGFLNGSKRLAPCYRRACTTPLCYRDIAISGIMLHNQDLGGSERILCLGLWMRRMRDPNE